MIEIARTLPNPDKIMTWLEKTVRSHLTPDVSNYAKGRLRVWLGQEPSLSSPTTHKPGLDVDPRILDRLRELVAWNFDYALVTYSGDVTPVGIAPHRDAAFTGYEAYGLHLSAECKFDYWCSRNSFNGPGYPLLPSNEHDAPSHSLILTPGQLVHFNCKNKHGASPATKRWNINLWKKKNQ